MTKTPKTFMPVEVAAEAGARSSTWSRLGEGPWTGTVIRKDGKELAVEELPRSWKVTDETGKSSTGAELAVALGKAGL